MPCRIDLRHDQHSGLIPSSEQDGVTIYAPEWVQEGLKILGEKLHGIKFKVYENDRNGGEMIEAFTTTAPLTLAELQKISRNERQNTSGFIKKSNYKPDIVDDALIYGIKDLVRQSIIVGTDETTHFGGYGSPRVQQQVPVYIVDLIGLQFQEPWNTGRLVLCEKSGVEGCLDHLIYENVVGERKKSFDQVEALVLRQPQGDVSRRYVPVENETYFDTIAYKKFVATDVMLCMQGLKTTVGNTMDANVNDQKCQVHFKFLKYGSGYFAGQYGAVIQEHILDGVVDGLEQAFERHDEQKDGPMRITSFEFPFYKETPDAKARLDELSRKYALQFKFGQRDALEMTAPDTNTMQYTLATTNCADGK